MRRTTHDKPFAVPTSTPTLRRAPLGRTPGGKFCSKRFVSPFSEPNRGIFKVAAHCRSQLRATRSKGQRCQRNAAQLLKARVRDPHCYKKSSHSAVQVIPDYQSPPSNFLPARLSFRRRNKRRMSAALATTASQGASAFPPPRHPPPQGLPSLFTSVKQQFPSNLDAEGWYLVAVRRPSPLFLPASQLARNRHPDLLTCRRRQTARMPDRLPSTGARRRPVCGPSQPPG